jgi:hypothetical protein
MRPILLVDDEANRRMVYDDFYDWEAEAFGVRPADLLELRGAVAWSFQPQKRKEWRNSESYSSTAATERGIQSVKANAPSAVTEDDSQPE